jgi:hypothetical protein
LTPRSGQSIAAQRVLAASRGAIVDLSASGAPTTAVALRTFDPAADSPADAEADADANACFDASAGPDDLVHLDNPRSSGREWLPLHGGRNHDFWLASSTGCSLSGATVSFSAAGRCVIDANQAGNTKYNAASQVQQSQTITQAKTLVTLTFDDGYENMITKALPILQQDELHGTFYVISGALNNNNDQFPAYMSWNQLQTLYQDGNEIAGRNVLHEALPQVDADEAIQEICQDRYDLMNPPATSGLAPGSLGPIADMAYPNGEGVVTDSPNVASDPGSTTGSTTTIESIVKACGYNCARTVDGVDDGTPNLAGVPLTSTDQYDPTSAAAIAANANDPLAMRHDQRRVDGCVGRSVDR